MAERDAGKVGACEIDGNGDPIPSTRRDFISDPSSAEGSLIDPLTGDFLFSTFGGGDRVFVVEGFTVPPPEPPVPGVPPPAALPLLVGALASPGPARRRG